MAAYDENSNHLRSLVNSVLNVKDSSWLQLDVCREFQRGACNRTVEECKFAHPPKGVEVTNGKITACFDSMKNKCTRENCKYLHPPQHLKDQLLATGKQNLAFKNQLMTLSNPAMNMKYQVPGMQAQQAAALAQAQIAAAAQAQGMPGMTYAAMSNPGMPGQLAVSTAGGYFTAVPTLNAAYAPYMQQGLQQFYQPGYVSPELLQTLQVQYANSMTALTHSSGTASPSSTTPSGVVNGSTTAGKTNAINGAAGDKSNRIEVCREFIRERCQRDVTDCKFAHPAAQVERHGDGTVSICLEHAQGVLATLLTTDVNSVPPLDEDVHSMCPRGASTCPFYHAPRHLLQAWLLRTANAMQQPTPLPANQYASNTSFDNATSASPAATMLQQQQQQQQLLLAQQQAAFLAAAAQQQQPQPTAQATTSATTPSTSGVVNPRKRPASQDDSAQQYAALYAAQSTDPAVALYLQQLAAAASYKRPALGHEKATIPMAYAQSAVSANLLGTSPQYATAQQFAAVPAQIPQLLTGAPLATAAPTQAQNGLATVNNEALAVNTAVAARLANMPNNAAAVAYFDETGQLLDTLPVCRDFKQGHCERINCRYVHLSEDYVEVSPDGKVIVCRDFAKAKCARLGCKYYHVPMLPSSAIALRRLLASQSSVPGLCPNLAPTVTLAPQAASVAPDLSAYCVTY